MWNDLGNNMLAHFVQPCRLEIYQTFHLDVVVSSLLWLVKMLKISLSWQRPISGPRRLIKWGLFFDWRSRSSKEVAVSILRNVEEWEVFSTIFVNYLLSVRGWNVTLHQSSWSDVAKLLATTLWIIAPRSAKWEGTGIMPLCLIMIEKPSEPWKSNMRVFPSLFMGSPRTLSPPGKASSVLLCKACPTPPPKKLHVYLQTLDHVEQVGDRGWTPFPLSKLGVSHPLKFFTGTL